MTGYETALKVCEYYLQDVDTYLKQTDISILMIQITLTMLTVM